MSIRYSVDNTSTPCRLSKLAIIALLFSCAACPGVVIVAMNATGLNIPSHLIVLIWNAAYDVALLFSVAVWLRIILSNGHLKGAGLALCGILLCLLWAGVSVLLFLIVRG